MQTIKKKGSTASKHTEPQLMAITNKALDLVSLHQNNIMLAAAVLAAVLVIIAGYTLFQSSNDKKASALLAVAQESYQDKAGAAPDYVKALEQYRTVQKNYSGTTSGAIAQFYVGNCLVNLNQPIEALKEYEALSKKRFVDKGLAGLAYQRMGYVYSALGRQAEAIAAFEQAETVLGPGMATTELAKIYERAGNGAEAQKKLKMLTEKLGSTAFAPEIQGAAAKGTPAPPAKGSAGK